MRPLSRIGFVGALLLSCLVAAPMGAQESVAGKDRAQGRGQRERDVQRQRRFRAMDTNRDGVITRAEWRGDARSFERHDWNRDGVLSGDEVWAPADRPQDDPDADWRARAEREEDALIRSFRQADVNQDGIISRSELRSGSESFSRVDSNSDGVITRREFLGDGWEGAVASRDEAGTSGSTRTDSPTYHAGYDRGLDDGRAAGRQDKELRNQWDLEGQRELEHADAGYTSALGPLAEYQAGYRAGFRTGYRQGFAPRGQV